ncbi:hypothetical protein ACFQAV_12815 [Companilactobacillus huachuanensis]|uniref:Glycosyl transferase family 3 N-terminal domain-containing protein n=1 Tax=Companilactobacillus huachuanensis TaxID=2559914 RepID=A0ABW1RQI3_9LACO|nr:hypothetical protein [Companilactobacillus huachuanensis]
MIENTIEKITKNEDLTYEETKQAFTNILNANATQRQISDFITALGSKKETVSEIAGTIDTLHQNTLNTEDNKNTLNKLGLRNDYSNSLNF